MNKRICQGHRIRALEREWGKGMGLWRRVCDEIVDKAGPRAYETRPWVKGMWQGHEVRGDSNIILYLMWVG